MLTLLARCALGAWLVLKFPLAEPANNKANPINKMSKSKSNQSKAAAKRAAKAAASGLEVSGVTLPVATPEPAPLPPPLPEMPMPAPAPTGNTPPAHFTPEEIELGQDPDGTWIASAISAARIINEFQRAQHAAQAAGLLPAPAKRYVSKTDPDSKYHNRERSTVQKPVAIVHSICAANPGLARKEIIALCLAQGVNKNTAATQYSMFQLKAKSAV